MTKSLEYERATAKQLVNQMRLFGKKRELIKRFNSCWKRYKVLQNLKIEEKIEQQTRKELGT
jgi:hypothetical protein